MCIFPWFDSARRAGLYLRGSVYSVIPKLTPVFPAAAAAALNRPTYYLEKTKQKFNFFHFFAQWFQVGLGSDPRFIGNTCQ